MAELVTKNVVDRTFAATRPRTAPWTVHAEWVVGGRIDAVRLVAAADATMGRHPLLSAREVGGDAWVVPDRPSSPAVSFRRAGSAGALADRRADVVSRAFDLRRGPPVRFEVVHAPGGDHVIVVADHALVDGVGIGRVAVSLMEAYASGRQGDVDSHWRAAHALAVGRPAPDQLERTVDQLRRRADPPAVRLAPEPVPERPGCGVDYRDLSAAAARGLASLPHGRCTANDVVVAAFCLAGMAWNRLLGRAAAPFTVGVPLNLRPARSWFEGVCNATLPWPVRVGDDPPGAVLGQVVAQLHPVRAGLYSPEVRAVLAHLAGRTRLSLRERQALATTTVVSTVPGADAARSHLPPALAGAVLHGGAPAPPAMGMTFAVVPDGPAHRLSARYLRSRHTAAGAATVLASVDDAVVHLCDLLARGGALRSDEVEVSP